MLQVATMITTNEYDTNVVATCRQSVSRESIDQQITTSIEDFFNGIADDINNCNPNCLDIMMIDLSFYGPFILSYLDRYNIKYKTNILRGGSWYLIEYKISNTIVSFREASTLIGADSLDLDLFVNGKETIDTSSHVSHAVTLANLHAKALCGVIIDNNMRKFTFAGESFDKVKEFVNSSLEHKKFHDIFPGSKNKARDDYYRRAYMGGETLIKPGLESALINEKIQVYDINGLHSYVMKNFPMPYGAPTFVKRKCKKLTLPTGGFYIARCMVELELKEGYLPAVKTSSQVDCSEMGIDNGACIISTYGKHYEMYLTKYDIELMKNHYDYDIEVLDFYWFSEIKGIFDTYIDYYVDIKQRATNWENKQYAKGMLNAVTGRFGKKMVHYKTIPYFDENCVLQTDRAIKENSKSSFTPLAVAVTSIGRYVTISACQANYDRFLYSDTDSGHFIDTGEPLGGIEIDQTRLGCWKLEGEYIQARYVGRKVYAQKDIAGNTHVVIAGMPKYMRDQVTLDNIAIGAQYDGLMVPQRVPHGTIRVPRKYTIRDSHTHSLLSDL